MFTRSLQDLMEEAQSIREQNFGNRVSLAIAHNYLPAKRCAADCTFCTWSRNAQIDYASDMGLAVGSAGIDLNACLATAYLARNLGAGVELISNTEQLYPAHVRRLASIIERASLVAPIGIQPGIVNEALSGGLGVLKSAGVSWYANDLETAPSFFPTICTTHTTADKLESIRLARTFQLPVFSGFCLGLGETIEQRLEAITALRDMHLNAVMLNFFFPVPGVALDVTKILLTPEDILRTICVMRIMMPHAQLIIGRGRQLHLKEMRDRIYEAGATGVYLGVRDGFLSPNAEDDLAIIKRLDLERVSFAP